MRKPPSNSFTEKKQSVLSDSTDEESKITNMRKNKTKNGERVQVKESEKSERTSDLSSYPIVKRRREVKAIRKAKDA